MTDERMEKLSTYLFNKSKCWILQLEWCNPEYMYRLGNEELEGSPIERDLGVPVNSKMNTSQQHALAARKANPTLGCLRPSTVSRSREGIVPHCSVLCSLTLGIVCSFGCHSK